jgi:hypothetical protein
MANATNITYGARVCLDNREAVSLPKRSRHERIVCTEGVIWVTFPGDPKDYLLKTGERLTVGKGATAVVSAIGKAAFCLVTAGDSPPRPVGEDLARTHAA